MWTCKVCYDEDELNAVAEKKLSHHYLQYPTMKTAPRASPVTCPLQQFKEDPLEPHKDRSLSPWRYV